MSDQVARSVLSRMHLREMVVAPHYTGMADDFRLLCLAQHESIEAEGERRRMELIAAYGFAPSEQRKPFAFSSGVAVIPVHGTLINRFGYSWGFVTGYNFIRQQTALAGQDSDVKGIVYDHNTYGGEAAGCFECSQDIKRLSNGKPTIAVVDSNCYSGGYALAAGCDRIICTPSGGAGSIGVAATHISFEKMLENAGVKFTAIFAGAHKVDGNPWEDLPETVKADIQKNVNTTMTAFVKLVSKGRKLDDAAVRATEARIYRAQEAKSLGLIDAVATPSAAMQAFMGELSGSNQQLPKEDVMSDDATKLAAEQQAAQSKLLSDAVSAERTRITAIQTCDEAKGREALANHLALNTPMSVADAKAMLAVAAKTETAAPAVGNALQATMNALGGPEVGADSSGKNEPGAKGAAGILANARLAGVTGYAFDKSAAKH